MYKPKGFALMTAIIVLVLFTTLGLVGVNLFSADMRIAQDTLRSIQALFLAEAAMQYEFESLSQDPDWSNNSDSLNKPMAGGAFNIEYIDRTPSSATIKFTGTKDGVSRKFTANISKEIPAFNYSVYIGGVLNDQNATNLSITGEVEENATALPRLNLSYYESIADHKFYQNRTFTAGTYSGIYYIDGNVSIESGVTINGSIIATGNINMSHSSNINVSATQSYLAIATVGNFIFQDAEGVTINGPIYVGVDMTGNFLSQGVEDITFNGTIIVAGNFNLQDSNNVTIIQGDGQIVGFLGLPHYNAWQETS